MRSKILAERWDRGGDRVGHIPTVRAPLTGTGWHHREQQAACRRTPRLRRGSVAMAGSAFAPCSGVAASTAWAGQMRAARAGVLMGSLLVSACGVTQARSLVRDGMSSRARPPTRGVVPGIAS